MARSEKRISTSFSMRDLNDICEGLSASLATDSQRARYERFCKLRVRLNSRLARAYAQPTYEAVHACTSVGHEANAGGVR